MSEADALVEEARAMRSWSEAEGRAARASAEAKKAWEAENLAARVWEEAREKVRVARRKAEAERVEAQAIAWATGSPEPTRAVLAKLGAREAKATSR